MTDTAIRVEGIGKLYRVGERESYQQLRDVLARRLPRSRNRPSTAPRTPSGPSATFPSP